MTKEDLEKKCYEVHEKGEKFSPKEVLAMIDLAYKIGYGDCWKSRSEEN